jgi:glycosyltransferase involved in cell wall biosynthesis
MKIALIVHAGPYQPARLLTGNDLRAEQLRAGLQAADHQVELFHPADLMPPDWQASDGHQVFGSPAQLHRQLENFDPAVAIVGYWELLEALPPLWPVPVVLDFLAPRPLELLMEKEALARDQFPRMIQALRRADHFLVGNPRQFDLLIGWILTAGFSCRQQIPISVVPNCQEPAIEPHAPPDQECLFVSGGVDWPWRQSQPWLQALDKALSGNSRERTGRLLEIAGRYKYRQRPGPVDPLTDAETSELRSADTEDDLSSYDAWRSLLRERAHVGLELSQSNVERHFAQSFRLADYLAAGLPALVSAESPLADPIHAHDAGWVVEKPAELHACVENILSLSRDQYQKKSQGALNLAREQLLPAQAIKPLLKWLEKPAKARPGNRWLSEQSGSYDGELPPLRISRRQAMISSFKRRMVDSALWLLGKLRTRRAGRTAMIITRSDIYPADQGAAVKIDRTAWGLSFLFDEVLILTDHRRHYFHYQAGKLSKRSFPWWIRLAGVRQSTAFARLSRRGVPYNECLLYLPATDRAGFLARTLYLACKFPVDWFQAEFPAYAWPALNAQLMLGGTVVMVEHNIEYQRIAEQYAQAPPEVLEWLKQMELRFAELCDLVITVSERDRACLIEDGIKAEKVHTIPHGVDLGQFEQLPARDVRAELGWPEDEPILIYHGTFAYAPNLEAVEVLAGEILPRLDALGLRVRVLAVGRDRPRVSLHPRIHFPGSVEKVAPWLKAADLAVVPLLQGGGTRMKILDYFAAGLAVVSTPKGIEGIPVRDGEHALIEEDFDAFARAIHHLLSDPAEAKRLGAAGKAFVSRQDWREIARRYVALSGTPPTGPT